jgi:Leucine-rich repeat (LRR) protein
MFHLAKMRSIIFAIALCTAAMMFISCSGSGTGSVTQDDDSYPSSVIDLRVRSMTPTSVTLEWTAPGNKDSVGTASRYDIRISKKEITWQNWDSAAVIPGAPTPSPHGTTDSMKITGLMADSSYYFALKAQGSSGNWSWLSNCVNAVCFDNFEVTFPDPRLDQIVRTAISKPSGAIYRADLLPITTLASNSDSVADLTGLEHCVNLRVLYLWQNRVTSVAPLAGLTKMTNLQLGENDIADIGPLSGLVNLQQLILNDNDFTDISALANMTQLSDVSLAGNGISNISALAGKPAMTLLNLERNNIIDISPLTVMTNLTGLNLSTNKIVTVTALSGMTRLTYLNLYYNQVINIAPLEALTDLEELDAERNSITDITALSAMIKMKKLNLVINQISNIGPLTNLTSLQELYLSYNLVSDLGPLSNLTSLVELQCMACQVVNISALQNLTNLHKVVLYYNQITDIEPLVLNSGINSGDLIYLTGNPLSQISIDTYIPDLTGRGVTVFYQP